MHLLLQFEVSRTRPRLVARLHKSDFAQIIDQIISQIIAQKICEIFFGPFQFTDYRGYFRRYFVNYLQIRWIDSPRIHFEPSVARRL